MKSKRRSRQTHIERQIWTFPFSWSLAYFIFLTLELLAHLKVAILFENISLPVHASIWGPGDPAAISGVKYDVCTYVIWIPADSCSSCTTHHECKVSQKGSSCINSLSPPLTAEPVPSSLPPLLISCPPQPALIIWSDSRQLSITKEQKSNLVKNIRSVCSWVTGV